MIHGFVKAASCAPSLRVGDCAYNKEQIFNEIQIASEKGVKILCFPELSLTGATCGDLFFQKTLLDGAKSELADLVEQTAELDVFFTVGFPYLHMGKLYNVTAAVYGGALLGIVPKGALSFEESRYFTPAFDGVTMVFDLYGGCVNFGTKLIFTCLNMPEMRIGIETGSAFSASELLCRAGATVILNPTAYSEIVGASDYQKLLSQACSAKHQCVYVLSGSGEGESSTDGVYSGYELIASCGKILAENKPFGNACAQAVVDLQCIWSERQKETSTPCVATDVLNLDFDMPLSLCELPAIARRPFIPSDKDELTQRCAQIVDIQSRALKRRLSHIGCGAVLGISGGLDSTLALLITVRAFDLMKKDRKQIFCVTMPGFGTTSRTKNNAVTLCEELGVSLRTVSIVPSVTQHFADIGHDITKTDITYENSQARERTQILMDIANQTGGIVIGTGDLSELTLGWCTYSGDQMSMYGVNGAIPKTLVRYLVNYFATESDNEAVAKTLFDILDTPVSPELLPPDEKGEIAQKTEDNVGPYDLHDFFIYYALRYGFTPGKIYRMCLAAWADVYDEETIKKWLKTFYRRFFTQQFKRSCMPDGPAVGTVSLSPRSGLKMPSDACAALWSREAEEL
ncbi:MAG: NAD(+) synthase [Clostridia bacterium]|nr:NAD(+) synthase [Clostridia bacterium]